MYASLVIIMACFSLICFSQTSSEKTNGFSHADSIRGSVTPERAWWDVTHYDLHLNFDYTRNSIRGFNFISFKIIAQSQKKLQIDLQAGLDIDSVISQGVRLEFKRDSNVYYIQWPHQSGETAGTFRIYYHGQPRIPRRPPWDGGMIWTSDKAGNPWISVTCQGWGASVWYPCKDYQGDEPDSASISMTVPDTLVAVANGRLRGEQKNADGTSTYTWAVVNPISNYDIIPYIGKYLHWHEVFNGEKGPLDCDYWALETDIDKAKEQFRQVIPMLSCFEHWFGPYPFYEDGYKLIEAPYLGMEHQSAVAYGNGFRNGYRGTDLSGTGWGLKWDFIIVHESGHEWFGNNITSKDIADMWVHESFTNYSEALYTECRFGKEAGSDYVVGTRKKVENKLPIIGKFGVNNEGPIDMYYKGGNMLHTIRQVIGDDEKFRQILRGLNTRFYHQTVNGADVEKYISRQSGIDFSKLFDQYLRTTKVPLLQYRWVNGGLEFRWENIVAGFAMPVKIYTDKEEWIRPSGKWQKLPTHARQITIDRNFFVESKEIN